MLQCLVDLYSIVAFSMKKGTTNGMGSNCTSVFIILHACVGGKAIGFVIVIIVDIKIAKSGDEPVISATNLSNSVKNWVQYA